MYGGMEKPDQIHMMVQWLHREIVRVHTFCVVATTCAMRQDELGERCAALQQQAVVLTERTSKCKQAVSQVASSLRVCSAL